MPRWTARRALEELASKLDHHHEHLVTTEDAVLHLHRRIRRMKAEMDRLATEVGEMKTVVESAVTMIGGIADHIRDLPATKAALTGFADELDASATALAAAVASGTPAEEPPVEEPPAEEPPVV